MNTLVLGPRFVPNVVKPDQNDISPQQKNDCSLNSCFDTIIAVYLIMTLFLLGRDCVLDRGEPGRDLSFLPESFFWRSQPPTGLARRGQAGVQGKGIVMMTSSNGNIFRVTGHLCGEFTGPGEFPTQRPVTRSFDVFFDLRLNKRLSKQSWGWWFETPSWSLWRHCNGVGHKIYRVISLYQFCYG